MSQMGGNTEKRTVKQTLSVSALRRKSRFLDRSTHLYKRVCPSVCPSVGPSVSPSVGPYVMLLRKMHEIENLMYRNDQEGIESH